MICQSNRLVKLLGLDIGDKRVGVAFGDLEMGLATPVDVFIRSDSERDAQKVAEYARNYGVDKIVAGLPRNSDGTLGPQAEATRVFAERVASAVALPLVLWDEHLTTVEASRPAPENERAARAASGRRRGRKARRTLDALAAAVILQDYINAQSNKGGQNAA